MLRIAIAVISGIIVYFAIDAEIMFSVLKKSDSPYAIFLACSVAGFVEKLVPNLMLKMGSGKPMLKEKHGDTTPKQTE